MSPEAVSRQYGSFARSLASATTRTRTARCGGASRSMPQADRRNTLRMKQLVSWRIIIREDRDVVVDDLPIDIGDGDVVEGLGKQCRAQAAGALDDVANLDALRLFGCDDNDVLDRVEARVLRPACGEDVNLRENAA